MIVLLCARAPGQIATTRFETFTSEDGLSDNYVLSAIQDHCGFLWFGMAVTHNRLEALGRLHGQRYRATITDLTGDQGSLGTRADILIPLEIPHKPRHASPAYHLHS